MFFYFVFTFMYAPRHQVKFFVRVNLPGNKPDSDRVPGVHQIVPDDRKGAECDYMKMFGLEWLEAGGGSEPSREFIIQHPRYLSLVQSESHEQMLVEVKLATDFNISGGFSEVTR